MMFPVMILVWIALLYLVSKLIEFLWVRALGFRPFRLFVGPGIIVHEYSHAAACLITRTKIHEIALFRENGGYVKHSKPPTKFSTFFMFFISFAPVIGCLLAVFLLMLIFNVGSGAAVAGDDVAAQTETQQEAEQIVAAADDGKIAGMVEAFLGSIWTGIKNILAPMREHNWLLGILYIWLLLSFTVGLAPSRQDMTNSLLGILIVVALLIGAGFAIKAAPNAQQTVASIFKFLSGMMAYTMAILAVALALSLIAIPIRWIRYKMMRKAMGY